MVAADKWVGRSSSKNIALTLRERKINELIVILLLCNSLHVMEAEVLLLCLQYPTTYPSSEPNTVYPIHAVPSYFFKIQFLIFLPFRPSSSKGSLPFSFPSLKPQTHFPFTHIWSAWICPFQVRTRERASLRCKGFLFKTHLNFLSCASANQRFFCSLY
jgi:hypothetical protein